MSTIGLVRKLSTVRLVRKYQLSPSEIQLVGEAKVIDFVGYTRGFHFSYPTSSAHTIMVRKSSPDFHYTNIKSCYFPQLKTLYLDNNFINSDLLLQQLNNDVDIFHETVYDKERCHHKSDRIHLIFPHEMKQILSRIKRDAIVLK
jgi:hypothetical protein